MGGIHIALIVLLVLALILVLIFFGLATFAVFPKRFSMEETKIWEMTKPYLQGQSFESTQLYTIASFDGYEIHAELIPGPKESNRYVIISHGYTYTRYGSYKYVYLFRKLGYHCIIYDDRGHGENKKARCMFGIRESKDLLCLINDAYRRFGKDIHLGLHGESMGAGLTIMALGEKPPIEFVVADCGYGNLIEVLCGQVKQVFHLPGCLAYGASFVGRLCYGFSLAKVTPIDALEENEIPICFIHGKADKFILCEQSLKMSERTRGYKEVHLFEGAGHAQSIEVDIKRYENVLSQFLEKVIRGE